ncbi:IclR family transcriptional regulator [Limnohabitans sp.]|uniref:IclR family transcriptional regulator n=1 Tax=Limnohabitans sp. TaxID=1907725 RepID=UPI0038BAE03D
MPRAKATPLAKSATPVREGKVTPTVTGGVVSLRRSLQLMELMSEGATYWSLAEISRSLGVNKAIVLRLIDELRATGFVYRDDLTGNYVLTYKLSNLGLRKLAQTRILDQSSGVLRELANETGELVRLGVIEFGKRVTWVLAFVGARRTLHIDPNYRLDVQLNTHAAGKAWLYTLEPSAAWTILQEAGIEQCTPYSKTTRQQIQADLDQSRERGFAMSYEENELHVGAIAAPIQVRQPSGQMVCVGVVSVAAPTSRMSEQDLMGLAPALLNGVAKLSDMWPIGDFALRPNGLQ